MSQSFANDASSVEPDERTESMPALEEITSLLHGMGGKLHNILADREDDFLQLGSSLMDFSNRSKGLSSEVSQLAQLASGEEITGRISDLQGFLEIISSHRRGMVDETAMEELSEIISSMQQLKELFQEFARVIKGLRMLGISTRIESARLGEQGKAFTSLADDVDKLVARIEESSSEIASRSNQIIATTLKVQEGTKELFTTQQDRLETVSTTLSENIEDLVSVVDQSERVSANLVTHSEDIASSTSMAVTNLQFHDIVRQQIEHVEECTRDAEELIAGYVEEGSSRYSLQQILTFVLQIATIQASQIQNGSEQFEKAVLDFKSQIENIATIVERFMQTIHGFSGSDHHSQGSVLEAIKSSMGEVIKNVHELVVGMQEQQKIIAPVAGTVEDMDSSAKKVQDLGDEIELISLNASIKSACVGDRGRAMGVLAHEIQRLSMQTKEHTSSVLDVLAVLATTSRQLQNRSTQTDGLQKIEETTGTQETSLVQLVELNDQMDQLFASVSALGDELKQDIIASANGIVFHEVICSRLAGAREDFLQIIDKLDDQIIDPAIELPKEFDELLHRYTMESERIIHQMALGLQHDVPQQDTSGDAGEQDVDLFDDDDGVDLFGDESGDDDGRVELFGDDEGVELFGDDDGVELF
ncbi:hypothetical protein [Desulfoplanes sp.]